MAIKSIRTPLDVGHNISADSHLLDGLSQLVGSQVATPDFEHFDIQVKVLASIVGGNDLVEEIKIIKHGKRRSVVSTKHDELMTFPIPNKLDPKTATELMAWMAMQK